MSTNVFLRVLVAVAITACVGEGTKPATTQAIRLAFLNQPVSVVAGSTIDVLQVAIQDASGNIVSQTTDPVTLAITSGTGSSGAVLSGTVTRTPADGIATFAGLGITKAGNAYTLNATASGVSSVTTGVFDVSPAAPTKLALASQPSATTAGTSLPSIQVRVHDAYGNTVTTANTNVTIAITGGTGAAGAVLGGTSSVATVNGAATFGNLTIDKAASGYTLSASSAGLVGASTNPFTISHGAAAALLVVTQPTSVGAGNAITPAVQVSVRDAFGNTVTSGSASVSAAIASGTGTSGAVLGGTLTRTASNGVASFNDLSVDRAGSGYVLNLSAAGLTPVATSAFDVSSAPPPPPPSATTLAFTVQPSAVAAGASIQPSVHVAVQDAGGNTVTTATNSITVALTSGSGASGAVLAGTRTRAAINGVATFDNLSITKAASGYTLDATATGLTSARSTAFAVSAAAAVKLVFTAQPSSVAQGATITPAVQVSVRDAYDNAVSTATNTITVGITNGTGASGAVLGGTLTRAATSGAAAFNNLTVDLAGTGYTLTATSSSLTNAVSSAFNVAASGSAGCANTQPGWIFCDDFEIDRTASYFEVSTDGGSLARVTGVGRNASYGMRSRFTTGQVSAGSMKLAFGRTPDSYFTPVDAGTRDYREMYWRVYVRNQPGWTGGGGDKLSRIMVFAAPNWAQAMIAHVWSGQSSDINYLMIDPASGTDAAGNLRTTQYNDFSNLRWLGSARSTTPLFSSANVGQWHCIETHVKLNTAGQSDGVFELRINGQLEASRTGLNWLGSYSAYGLNALFLESYWNAGSPANQERYFDDFVVSEQPIGC
jgi:hypothetical protein